MALHPVSFLGETILFVAFDREAAAKFANAVNDDCECEVTEIDELALIDTLGFPCQRKDAGFLFPWLATVKPETAAWYAKEEIIMSPAEMTAWEKADAARYWDERYGN
jgi:hypothetical protein